MIENALTNCSMFWVASYVYTAFISISEVLSPDSNCLILYNNSPSNSLKWIGPPDKCSKIYFTNKGWRQLGPHPICKIIRAHTWPNEIYLLPITYGWNELKNVEQLAPNKCGDKFTKFFIANNRNSRYKPPSSVHASPFPL